MTANPHRLRIALAALMLLLWGAGARGAELLVDPANGPYKTIAAAISAAGAGDTVTVGAGVYAEAVSLKPGLPGRPFTLRAALGASVTISGFQAVTGWQPWRGGIYTTSANWAVRNLYVGYAPQRIARSPNPEQPWHRMSGGSGTLITAAPDPPLADLAGGNPFLFGFTSAGNVELHLPVASVAAATNAVTLVSPNTSSGLQTGNRFILCNHRDLIDRPGEWAYETIGSQTVLYFWPRTPAELQQTQSSRGRTPVTISNCANVSVEGLELAGGVNGVYVQNNSSEVTIKNCLVHDNTGTGIYVRDCASVTVSGCLALRNNFGVSVTGGHKVVVEECEIAFNQNDGLRVTGDPARRPEWKLGEDVTARRNYIHHHLYLSHPDNIQLFSGTRRFRLEDSLLLFGGQALMTEVTNQDNVVSGNVVFSTGAFEFQTHADSLDWSFERNLFGFGGWGAISMDGANDRRYENILYRNAMEIGANYQGDRNVIWPVGGSAVQVIELGVYKKGYATVAAFATATGQDTRSVQADPLLRNAPLDQGLALSIDDANCTTASLIVRRQPSLTQGEIIPFTVRDLIEVNGDGVRRQVTSVAGDRITFAPPLPDRPFREGHTAVWRWGGKTDFQLDTRPNAAGPAGALSVRGGPVGSMIDVRAYQAGDFDGDGARDLPAIPEGLKTAWPDANDPLIPVWSPL